MDEATNRKPETIRLVCISDTHGLHDRIPEPLPDGDILIHAGDMAGNGSLAAVEAFNAWLARQPHAHKIVIAGNHDRIFEEDPQAARAALTGATYLQDEGVEIFGIRFWGSPWTPEFMNWHFMLSPGSEQTHWAQIPTETDVLITHGPPHRFLDEVQELFVPHKIKSQGCPELRQAVQQRVQPALQVYGHIHEGYGYKHLGKTLFVNASTCTERYQPTNAPIVIDLRQRANGWHTAQVR